MVELTISHALFIAIAVIGVGALATFSTGFLDSVTQINEIEISPVSVLKQGSDIRLIMTVKNSGTSLVQNMTATVTDSDENSHGVSISNPIEIGKTQSVNSILTVSGTSNQMTSLIGEEVTVLASTTYSDGSQTHLKPIKIKVE